MFQRAGHEPRRFYLSVLELTEIVVNYNNSRIVAVVYFIILNLKLRSCDN